MTPQKAFEIIEAYTPRSHSNSLHLAEEGYLELWRDSCGKSIRQDFLVEDHLKYLLFKEAIDYLKFIIPVENLNEEKDPRQLELFPAHLLKNKIRYLS
ncbi:MAG: hypothetical protein EBS19_11845 [Spirochaetia bacterium]|nr:hypothetical protein [Spirochaetia bacterium]